MSELVVRVASLQTTNWQKDERIAHLEQGAAAMAQDLMAKAAIIQHYCAQGRWLGQQYSAQGAPIRQWLAYWCT